MNFAEYLLSKKRQDSGLTLLPNLTDFDIQNGVLVEYHGNDENVVIPNGIKSINNYAFADISSATIATVPNSVASIGDGAFSGCSNLTIIAVSGDNPSFASVDGVLFNKEKTELFCCPAGISGTYVIPGNVTSIRGGAFEGCKQLTAIVIPNSVIGIGEEAFCDCIGLTNITIPNSVKSIKLNLFRNCVGLEQLSIGTGVTDIGDCAFSDCRRLESIIIPGNVESIGSWAFSDCCNLASVTIEDGLKSIGKCAFHGCDSLTSVKIPDSVTDIGDDAFGDCDDLVIHTSLWSFAKEYACEHGILVSCDDADETKHEIIAFTDSAPDVICPD